MKHLSDTGKQIEDDMRRKHPGAPSLEQQAEDEEAAESELALEERPPHPIAALWAVILIVAALAVALTVTALYFLAAIFVVPVAILGFCLLGIWAFWSWERRKRQAARRDTPGRPA